MLIYQTTNNYKIYHLLTGRCNVYFISGNNINIMIDAGKKNVFKKLIKTYHSLQILPKSINYLILTHTHFDHCQNANTLKDIFKYKILSSPHETKYTKEGFTPLPIGVNTFTKIISSIGNIIGKSKFGYDAFIPDLWVEDEYVINENIKIIATPGHSIGSISIIVDNEVALVGDTLFGIFKNSVFPPFADDISLLIKSWDKLIQTKCKLFLPGHGRPISLDLLTKEYEKYKRKYLLKK